MSDELYDVSQYSENELFDILDLVNPTDRELEAKIIMMIRKYENDTSNPIMSVFFEEIYNRFFEGDDDEENEYNESGDFKEGMETMKKPQNKKKASLSVDTEKLLKDEGIKAPTKAILTTSEVEDDGDVAIKDNKGQSESKAVTQTAVFQYTKGKLNPVLKETITRTMTLDSKFRDRKLYKNASSYTVNLSETLHNVVAMRYFAVNIPYTWYTVTNDYGANFFLLKGISPGINDGTQDIKFSIPPGHYNNEELVNEVSIAIQNAKTKYTNINFGSTDISLNYIPEGSIKQSSGRATFVIDIENIYDATSYALQFPTWSDPYGAISVRKETIPGFLGFSNKQYIPNSIYSSITQFPSGIVKYSTSGITIPNTLDLTKTFNLYFKDIISSSITYKENNYLTILNYQDPTNSGYLKPFTITANETQGSNILKLVSGTLSDIYIGSIATGLGIPPGSIVTEIDNFTSEITISNVAASTNLGVTITVVGSNVMDTITVTLASSNVINKDTVSYYTRSDIISNLNTSLQSNPQLTKDSNASIIKVSYKDSTGTTYTYEKIKLTIILNRSTTKQIPNMKQYIQLPDETTNPNPIWVGANSCFLFDVKLCELNDIYSDTNPLSISYVINSSPTIKLRSDVTGSPEYTVTIPNGTYTKSSYIEAIQTALLTINSPPNVTLEVVVSEDSNLGKLSITISFHVIISPGNEINDLDYEMIFSDSGATNSWVNYLGLMNSNYILKNYHTKGSDNCKIIAEKPIKDETISIDFTNNKFNISPQTTTGGLYTTTGDNTVPITIPDGNYTKAQLYSIINSEFSKDSTSNGSLIQSIWDASGNEYVKLRLNMNKIYTAKDYSLTFYNFTDYVSCITMPDGHSTLTPIPWEGTLGWMLGFHSNTSYNLNIDYNPDNVYTNNEITGVVTLRADSVVNTNSLTNIYIVLEDYAQNHINDGIVSATPRTKTYKLPSYTSLASAKCDPVSSKKTILSYDNLSNPGGLLTSNQYFAGTEQLRETLTVDNSNLINITSTSMRNIMSVVFLNKLPTWGQPFVDNGGGNLNQDRKYFGPVNISRITLQLINDQGYLMDLNGSDWSVTLLCDMLYTSHDGK